MKTEKWAGDGYTLKPCPLCGAEPEERSPQENGDRFWTIRCPGCGLKMGGSHRYMNQEIWNRRTIGGAEPRYAHPMCPEEDEK